MCGKHLLGEHLEMHMFLSSVNLGRKIEGFIRNGLVEVHNIKRRHSELVAEMLKRGWKHNSPISELPELAEQGCIDKEKSMHLLFSRCKDCKERYEYEKQFQPSEQEKLV